MWSGGVLRADVFRIDSGPANAGECKVKNFAVSGLERIGAFQFGLRIDGIQLCQCSKPVVIKIGGAWVRAFVGLELSEWVVESGHGFF